MEVTYENLIIVVKISFFWWNMSFYVFKNCYQKIFEINGWFGLGYIRGITFIFFDQFT